jgi:hypothetical protein
MLVSGDRSVHEAPWGYGVPQVQSNKSCYRFFGLSSALVTDDSFLYYYFEMLN